MSYHTKSMFSLFLLMQAQAEAANKPDRNHNTYVFDDKSIYHDGPMTLTQEDIERAARSGPMVIAEFSDFERHLATELKALDMRHDVLFVIDPPMPRFGKTLDIDAWKPEHRALVFQGHDPAPAMDNLTQSVLAGLVAQTEAVLPSQFRIPTVRAKPMGPAIEPYRCPDCKRKDGHNSRCPRRQS